MLTLHIQAKANPAESVALEIGFGEDKKPAGADRSFRCACIAGLGYSELISELSLFPGRCKGDYNPSLCLISQVRLCLKQMLLVQGGSPYLHGGHSQRAEFVALITVFSLLTGKSG